MPPESCGSPSTSSFQKQAVTLLSTMSRPLFRTQKVFITSDMFSSLSAVQSTVTATEISLWKTSGAMFRTGVLFGPDNKP